jgi:hypothetical protein
MNQELKRLYFSKWNALCSRMKKEEFETRKPASPLLLFVEDEEEYQKSDIRIMVFGQETNSWFSSFDENNYSMDIIIKNYSDFFKNGGVNKQTPFWRGVKLFKKKVEEKFTDQNKKTSIIWNNIIKIGRHKAKGKPPEEILKIEKKYFSVIQEEIRIINPNVILFLTGPRYDVEIDRVFNKPVLSTLNSSYKRRELAKVQLDQTPFTYRTYHPQFLLRSKKMESIFENIIGDINF